MVATTKSNGSRPVGAPAVETVAVAARRAPATETGALRPAGAKNVTVERAVVVVVPKRAHRTPGLLVGLDDEAVRAALAFDEPVTSGGRTDLIPDRA